MHFAEVSVPGVPTVSSQVLLHHQSIFPSYSDPFRLPTSLQDAHDKEAPTTSYRGDTTCWWCRDFSVHWRPRADRRTGCRSRNVHGVAHDRRLWWSLLLAKLPSLEKKTAAAYQKKLSKHLSGSKTAACRIVLMSHDRR